MTANGFESASRSAESLESSKALSEAQPSTLNTHPPSHNDLPMDFLKRLFARKPKIDKVDIKRRFELHGRVGQGSMSKVWRATDTIGSKPVALKVLDKPRLARLDNRFKSLGLKRPHEGEVSLSLRHPNIVKTTEFGITTDDEEFLVMEFVDGVSLSYLVETQSERMRKNCLWYCIQLGDALEAVHRAGYIHRDLCPRNVIVSKDDVIKLIDFGLVVPNTAPYKKPGNRTGTANYMAPELIKRQATDERIDIFSFGVTCFEMFTRQLPWDSGDTLESVLQHINAPPRELKKMAPKLDEQVCSAIMQGLKQDPRDRWQTVREMCDDLRKSARRLGAMPEED